MIDTMTKEELVEKARAVLATLRYLDVEEVYLLDSQLSNAATTEEEVRTLYESMLEFKKEQDEAYAEYKAEMIAAATEYAKDVQAIKEKQASEKPQE